MSDKRDPTVVTSSTLEPGLRQLLRPYHGQKLTTVRITQIRGLVQSFLAQRGYRIGLYEIEVTASSDGYIQLRINHALDSYRRHRTDPPLRSGLDRMLDLV